MQQKDPPSRNREISRSRVTQLCEACGDTSLGPFRFIQTLVMPLSHNLMYGVALV
jgi:hypothetical protein